MAANRVLNLTLDDCVAEEFDTKTPHNSDVNVQYTLRVYQEDGVSVDATPDVPMFWSALLDILVASAASEQCTLSAEEARRVLGPAFVEVMNILDRRAAQEEMTAEPCDVPALLH